MFADKDRARVDPGESHRGLEGAGGGRAPGAGLQTHRTYR